MQNINEDNVGAGSSVLGFLLGYTGSAWERLKSLSGALAVAYQNASALAYGSKATSSSAVAVGAATAYTGGVVLSNLSTTAAEVIYIGATSGVTAAIGAGNYPLAPGKDLVFPTGNLAGIFVIAASGTPTLGWIGVTA